MPGQPKLRSSCDRCGIAKVKCDRGHPECGRCVSHGMACVYGVSRKIGKPPRRPSLSRTSSNHAAATDSSSSSGGIMLDIEPFPSGAEVPTAWDAMDYDSSANSDLNRLHPWVGLFQDLPGPSLSNFPPLEGNEWAMADHSGINLLSTTLPPGPGSTPPSPKLGSYLSTTAYCSQDEDCSNLGQGSTSAHDCPREAYKIVESLSFLNVSQAHYGTSPGTAPATTTQSVAHQVPLDLVLRLTREASERLVPLLTCPCARSPHLAFLYASIISRILAWYQQAAGSSQNVSPPISSTAAASSLSIGGSNQRTATSSSQSPALAVIPAMMAIGTFNVDDLHVQTAMKIQLVSAEMRRVGRLIDKFSSEHSRDPYLTDETSIGDIDSLYQTLSLWLKRDHSRIANMLRSELRELNI
ncbi:hypothetical protein EYZ11_005452 [Aspergillus tanneri]|uniref:Zn(2)-C6 fungal-type domain-containing protein n=1 Tax=Aspergillus tanneri TaxID=1220188 RepID=A0A4S3JK99_9EURO|nr:uncharacterized protein ATNIH1004_008278 [Aspergillus tanneri]KAA8644080.1 hypothetical protein ATNIH1004_008278 [Aspergillus tanneri]THC95057.1 hypothetical protein EYZ11_005452 [Aspergillus tanneri]